ncbi:MAG: hypothetical protein PHG98_03660, partial [Bacteroidales bacterium]|nr:hypothetical protein [Bacteroidales bacterium]MDD4739027.1 hypothetical protein [Bacteroidales bacterium]
MEFDLYFNPLDIDEIGLKKDESSIRLGDEILVYGVEGGFPAIEHAEIAIIGVEEERNAYRNNGCKLAPNQVRKYFYNL